MFTMTGKHDLHGEETALSDDNDLSSLIGREGLIAGSNVANNGGFKSQTLQFQTALGNDFLDLFAREGEEDADNDDEDET